VPEGSYDFANITRMIRTFVAGLPRKDSQRRQQPGNGKERKGKEPDSGSGSIFKI
jgi:hypothetical protein